jgi:hypothetical protein
MHRQKELASPEDAHFGVNTVSREAKNEKFLLVEIQHRILGEARTRIKTAFTLDVKVVSRIGNFGDQKDIFDAGMPE